MNNLQHFILLLLSSSTLSHSTSLTEQINELKKTPFPKVYRAVLDERPRMLIVTLDDKHAIAYDTWHGMLGCAWKVDSGPLVKLDGAVYNGKHGPQPSRNGTTLFENNNAEFSSPLGQLHYLGHAFRNGKTVLRYGIKDKEHKRIATIEEIPQWSGSTLKRSFRVLPATMGAHITFTPAPEVPWKKGHVPLTSTSLAKPLTISTTL